MTGRLRAASAGREGVNLPSRRGDAPYRCQVKSPPDRHTMEQQMVAETVISYGFDSWFDEPEKTDESDSLFDDYDTGAIYDLFAEPAPPAAKPEPKKTKRAAAADIFDDWFDQEPETDL